MKIRYFKIIVRVFFWIIYWFSGFMPRKKNIWIFGTWEGRRFADNSKYFYLYINEYQKKDVRAIWISKEKTICERLNKEGFEAYTPFSIRGIYYCLKGKVWIYDVDANDIIYWLSRKTFKINLWHGIPLKKIGYDDKNSKWINSSGLMSVFYRIVAPWMFTKANYYLSSSEKVSKMFESAFQIQSEELLISCFPRNVALFSSFNGEEIGCDDKNFLKVKNLKKEKAHIILYMPTFRDKTSERFWDIISIEELNMFLDQIGAKFLIKPHFYSNLNKVNTSDFHNIVFIESWEDPYPYLRYTDVLITDYSSIFFDFYTLERPIIFFCYDLEDYLKNNRQMYFNYDDISCGEKACNFNQLKNVLITAFAGKDNFSKIRDKIVSDFFSKKQDLINLNLLYQQIASKIN